MECISIFSQKNCISILSQKSSYKKVEHRSQDKSILHKFQVQFNYCDCIIHTLCWPKLFG